MFSHVMVGTNDATRAKTFYDAVFDALNANPGMVDGKGRLIYLHKEAFFAVGKPLNGEPASCANGATIGFACSSPEQVDAWHAAGIASGGTTCEDPPGIRDSGSYKHYVAYLRDPDGNKLCALHRM